MGAVPLYAVSVLEAPGIFQDGPDVTCFSGLEEQGEPLLLPAFGTRSAHEAECLLAHPVRVAEFRRFLEERICLHRIEWSPESEIAAHAGHESRRSVVLRELLAVSEEFPVLGNGILPEVLLKPIVRRQVSAHVGVDGPERRRQSVSGFESAAVVLRYHERSGGIPLQSRFHVKTESVFATVDGECLRSVESLFSAASCVLKKCIFGFGHRTYLLNR